MKTAIRGPTRSRTWDQRIMSSIGYLDSKGFTVRKGQHCARCVRLFSEMASGKGSSRFSRTSVARFYSSGNVRAILRSPALDLPAGGPRRGPEPGPVRAGPH